MIKDFFINYFHVKEDFTGDLDGKKHQLAGVAKIATMVLSLGIFPAVIGILKKFNKIDPYPSATKSQFTPPANSAPQVNNLPQTAVGSVAGSRKTSSSSSSESSEVEDASSKEAAETRASRSESSEFTETQAPVPKESIADTREPSSSSSSESSEVEDASSKEAAETRPSRSESSELPETQAPVPEESVAVTRRPSRSSSSELSEVEEAAPVERNRDTQETQEAYILRQMLKWNDAKEDEKHSVLKEIITDPESSEDRLGFLLKNLKIPQEMLVVHDFTITRFGNPKKYLPTETAALLMEKGIDIFDGLEVQKNQLATKEDLTVKFAMTWDPEDPVNSESIFWLKMMIKSANTGSVKVDPKAFILAILNLSWIPKETVEHPEIQEALREYHLYAKSIVSGSTGNFFYGFIRKAIDVAYGKITPDQRSKEYERYSKQFRLVELELHLGMAGLGLNLKAPYDTRTTPIKDDESLNHYLDNRFLGDFFVCFSEEHFRNIDVGISRDFHNPKNFNRHLFFLEVLRELLKDNPGLESSLNLGRILEVRFFERFVVEFKRSFKTNSRNILSKSHAEILGQVFLVFELSYKEIQGRPPLDGKEYLKALGDIFGGKLLEHSNDYIYTRGSQGQGARPTKYLEREEANFTREYWKNSFHNYAEQNFCREAVPRSESLIEQVRCLLPPKTAVVQAFENAEVDHTLKGHKRVKLDHLETRSFGEMEVPMARLLCTENQFERDYNTLIQNNSITNYLSQFNSNSPLKGKVDGKYNVHDTLFQNVARSLLSETDPALMANPEELLKAAKIPVTEKNLDGILRLIRARNYAIGSRCDVDWAGTSIANDPKKMKRKQKEMEKNWGSLESFAFSELQLEKPPEAPAPQRFEKPTITVSTESTQQAVERFSEEDPDREICWLNIADPLKTGGNYQSGMGHQEEQTLTMSDGMVTLGNVSHLSTSDGRAEYDEVWQKASGDAHYMRTRFLTGKQIECKSIALYHDKQRVKPKDIAAALLTAVHKGHRTLILSATFGENPEEEAKLWQNAFQYKFAGHFDRIHFAIHENPEAATAFIVTFSEAFKKEIETFEYNYDRVLVNNGYRQNGQVSTGMKGLFKEFCGSQLAGRELQNSEKLKLLERFLQEKCHATEQDREASNLVIQSYSIALGLSELKVEKPVKGPAAVAATQNSSDLNANQTKLIEGFNGHFNRRCGRFSAGTNAKNGRELFAKVCRENPSLCVPNDKSKLTELKNIFDPNVDNSPLAGSFKGNAKNALDDLIKNARS